jgi:hypothetical protein
LERVVRETQPAAARQAAIAECKIGRVAELATRGTVGRRADTINPATLASPDGNLAQRRGDHRRRLLACFQDVAGILALSARFA